MIDNIIFILTGIFITLTIYHGMMYVSRSTDIRQLAFTLMNTGLLVLFLSVYYSSDLQKISGTLDTALNIGTHNFYFCTFIFFLHSYTKTYDAKKSTQITIVILSAAAIITFILSLFIIKDDIAILFYRIIVITVGIILLIRVILRYKKINYFHSHKFRLRHISMLIAGLLMIILGIYGNAAQLSKKEFIVLFAIPGFLFSITFAFTLIDSFNKEHRDLKELKENLEKKVNERTDQLKQANQEKTQFFINLAHETKTPLTLINNYFNEYVKKKGENFETNIIKNNLEKLTMDMVNFLEHEKIQTGQIFFCHDKIINFSKSLHEQILLFRELAKQKHIKIETKIQENVLIKIDPAALVKIINNLIENAIKYTQPEGEVFITLAGEKETAVFCVSDNGPGISIEHQKNIFEPYYQLSHNKRNVQGMGMGLSIIKKIITQLGGNISYSDNRSRGSCFTVRLEKAIARDVEVINSTGNKGPTTFISHETELREQKFVRSKKTIFILEDNIDLLYFLQSQLSDQYNIFYSTNGKEALKKLQIIPHPDLLISDVMMDEMDGFEFFEYIKKIKSIKSVPFIFLTALTSDENKLEGLHKGAVDYIFKPFDIKELQAKINSLLTAFDALKKENILNITERLYQYLQTGNSQQHREDFIESMMTPQDCLKGISSQFEISPQQIRIIALLKAGLLRKEICDRLDISMNTLKTHMTRLYKKCSVDNKTELLNIFY